MIFLSLRVTADAEGGLKNRAHLRPVLQGFGGGQPPTSTRRVYTGALLAATVTPVSRYRSLCFLKAVIGTLNYAGRSGDFGAYFYDFFLQRPHIIPIGVCFPAQFLQTLDFP